MHQSTYGVHQGEKEEENSMFTVTIEIPAHSVSPKLYKILTGRRMLYRYQMIYFARETLREISKKFSKSPHSSTISHNEPQNPTTRKLKFGVDTPPDLP